MLAAADLARAAAVLNEGEKVAVLIGQGARNAWLEVEALADVLGAGVAKALLGKDALPDDLPYVTGSIGLLGTRPSYEMMRDCDTLLVVGSSFPYTQFLPEFGRARAVQIDIDPFMVDLRYPFEVNLVGDAGEALRALLPDDVMLAADSGSAANWYARHLRMRKAMRGSLSGTLATMGPGVPYAIGAKFAHPDRLAVAIVGDGVMQMNGMAELITAAKYFWDWQGPRLVVAVLNNQDLNQVTWEMRAMSGAPTSYPRRHCPTCPTRTSQGPSGWAAYGWRSRTAWSPPEAGPGRRPSLRHRLPYRPRRAADSAARRPRPDRSHRRRDPQGRQRPCWDGPAGSQGQDPGDPAGSRPLPSRRRRSMMGAGRRRVEEPSVDGVDAAAYTVPTDAPEGDGTLAWLDEPRPGPGRGSRTDRTRVRVRRAVDRRGHPARTGPGGDRPVRLGRPCRERGHEPARRFAFERAPSAFAATAVSMPIQPTLGQYVCAVDGVPPGVSGRTGVALGVCC